MVMEYIKWKMDKYYLANGKTVKEMDMVQFKHLILKLDTEFGKMVSKLRKLQKKNTITILNLILWH